MRGYGRSDARRHGRFLREWVREVMPSEGREGDGRGYGRTDVRRYVRL